MTKYNRLNSMYKNMLEDFREPWKEVNDSIRNLTSDAYEESYFKYGFLLNKNVGININYGAIDKRVIRSLFNEPNVSGLSLAETLGRTRYNLLLRERQSLVQGFIRGDSYVNIVKDLRQTYDKSFNDLLRIARTEGNRAANEGQVKAYDDAEEMGIEIDRIWITGGRNIRDAHQFMEGQKADEEGYFHYDGNRTRNPGGFGVASLDVNCKCSVIAKPKGTEFKVRRSNIGKKNIVEYKTFEEWEKDQKKS